MPSKTRDWKFSFLIKTECITEPVTAECPRCSGRGRVGGGFHDPDEERDCPNCTGGKNYSYAHIEPRPELPQGLMAHMEKAWNEYFTTMDQFNEYFKPQTPRTE